MIQHRFSILFADDEDTIRNKCVELLRGKGYEVRGAAGGYEALSLFKKHPFALVVADIRMPGIDGIELLERIKEIAPDTEVILITGYGTIDSAVKAMKLGAYDYLAKPFEVERLLRLVENVATKFSLKKEIDELKRELDKYVSQFQFISVSYKIRKLLELVERVSRIDCNVLIQGESGTGKSLLARIIHRCSHRSAGPFVVVDCASLPETLLESELFGYVKGAFTGASRDKDGYFKTAHGGTILLDEISELPPFLQSKLLRIVQDREFSPVGSTRSVKVDTRIIAATNKDIEELVREGKFREDLYFRLNVVNIRIPPLRERREDILPLFYFFFERFKKMYRKERLEIKHEILKILQEHDWPGNVRELENLAQFLVITCEDTCVSERNLPDTLREKKVFRATWGTDDVLEMDFKSARRTVIQAFTRQYLLRALERSGWNISETARDIGIPRPSLQRIMKRYGITAGKYPPGSLQPNSYM